MTNTFVVGDRMAKLQATELQNADTTHLSSATAKALALENRNNLQMLDIEAQAPVFVRPKRSATSSDVQEQQVSISVLENNLSVAERLKISPAQNANQYAQAGLQDLLQRLIALNPKGQTFAGINLRDVKVSGYSRVVAGNNQPLTLGEMIDNGGVARKDLFKFDENQATNNLQAVQDQAAHFYRAVFAVDNNVLILRQVEARIAEYKRLRDEALALQAKVQNLQAQADARLAVINDELITARNRVSVARQLKAEEEKRVAAVNARRKAILDQVNVVIFHKARMMDRFTPLPVKEASSVAADGTLQLPIRAIDGVPLELTEMLQNFRDAPLHWFDALHDLPQYFDSPTTLYTAFEHVRLRATSLRPVIQIPSHKASGLIKGARAIIDQQASQARDWRKLASTLNTQLIDLEGMTIGHDRLRHAATLGDMIDGGHCSAPASKRAAQQMEDITKTAASLYGSFADTPAALRLQWAEDLIDDLGKASFRALHVLPGWLTQHIDLQREQQQLVDHLYRQVVTTKAEAEVAINRLVLVALLVAAHAPVTKLISARMVRPVLARRGAIFDLTLDASLVRIGMGVTVQNKPGEVAARAIVDDIVGSTVRARVVDAMVADVPLALDAIVQISNSISVKTSMKAREVVR